MKSMSASAVTRSKNNQAFKQIIHIKVISSYAFDSGHTTVVRHAGFASPMANGTPKALPTRERWLTQ